MSKYDKIPKGVKDEFDDIDYWHKLPKNKFVTLEDGTKISEYEYMKQFMGEVYGNRFDRDNSKKNIIKTKEQKKWAVRNNNNTNRDALNVSKKMGALSSLFNYHETSLKDVEESWEVTFKTGSYEEAFQELMETSTCDMEFEYNVKNLSHLFKMYLRIKRFLLLLKRDKKLSKEKR